MRREDGDEKIWSSKQRCTSTTEIRQSMHPLMDGQWLQQATSTKNHINYFYTRIIEPGNILASFQTEYDETAHCIKPGFKGGAYWQLSRVNAQQILTSSADDWQGHAQRTLGCL